MDCVAYPMTPHEIDTVTVEDNGSKATAIVKVDDEPSLNLFRKVTKNCTMKLLAVSFADTNADTVSQSRQ